jgi:hypothetical protein
MTGVAFGLSAEQRITTLRRVEIEVDTRSRLHGRQSELIEMECGQLPGDPVGVWVGGNVAKTRLCGDGKLSCIIESLIKERSNPGCSSSRYSVRCMRGRSEDR